MGAIEGGIDSEAVEATSLRSVLRRLGMRGMVEMDGLMDDSCGTAMAVKESGDCSTRSRKGLQKYNAWMTEFA